MRHYLKKKKKCPPSQEDSASHEQPVGQGKHGLALLCFLIWFPGGFFWLQPQRNSEDRMSLGSLMIKVIFLS